MQLSELRQGQQVIVRHGRAGETAPNWSPWRATTIAHLARREKALPQSMRRRSNAPNVGDILTLAIDGWPAEYGQGDYCGNGEFVAEDYYLQIEGLNP